MGDQRMEYPGWQELPPEAKKRIRARIESAAERRPSPALEEAYKRVMLDALMHSIRLFEEYATAEERARELSLLRLVRECDDTSRHVIQEQMHILDRTVQARRDAADARAQKGDESAADVMARHERWVRQMQAARLALDNCGLHGARVSIENGRAFVSMNTADDADFAASCGRLKRMLRSILGPDEQLRLSFAGWHEVKLPPKHEDEQGQ